MKITKIEDFELWKKHYKCLRCNHDWLPRKTQYVLPRMCPKCKSIYWSTHRKKKIEKLLIE